MLARRLTTILPDMTLAEAVITTRIHSVAGLKVLPPIGRGPHEVWLAPAGSDQIVASPGGQARGGRR